ncbi:AMP nucleosidase [Commensalibacter oyaizuii]|uniref:AMP nucleosidase n=1 Tax=Commensalibacter oyaizuii TaxID=3043873 RepID=A0ABT6Q013_9PROT|nr:AMP nucleosidase [Commensalibacter sp. TBRC 16381]MDI2090435.1 AMP nucleosidase [Commensalibacter sp. TBRC 16381]
MTKIYTQQDRWLFTDANAAVDQLIDIYQTNVSYLKEHYIAFCNGHDFPEKIRACYPEIRFDLKQLTQIDHKLSYGFFENIGHYSTSITQPQLFRQYLYEQISKIMANHHIQVEIGVSSLEIPIKFVENYDHIPIQNLTQERLSKLDRTFTNIDMTKIDDGIADGSYTISSNSQPLCLFNALRVDLALQRLEHYTGCSFKDFQNFIILTNYPFHIDYFARFSVHNLGILTDDTIPKSHIAYQQFITPNLSLKVGDEAITNDALNTCLLQMNSEYQMPACHLTADNHQGITIVNIGVGPSNAKTITDCLAVLRPHCWLMVGHCAGLDSRMNIGDMILANSFERKDFLLDHYVPLAKPIPILSEIQTALQKAYIQVRALQHHPCSPKDMRTGTVLTVADRNWEWETSETIRSALQSSTSIAVDMESATIATNGYRFRIPYGVLLSVSDKPLHNQPKLPRSARHFYNQSRAEHILTAIFAFEIMMENSDSLHSRKLRRTVGEVAFR